MITWSPDTCKCVYEIDENFNLISAIYKCSIHDHMGDAGAFSSAWARGKNNNQQNQGDFGLQATEALRLKKETT